MYQVNFIDNDITLGFSFERDNNWLCNVSFVELRLWITTKARFVTSVNVVFKESFASFVSEFIGFDEYVECETLSDGSWRKDNIHSCNNKRTLKTQLYPGINSILIAEAVAHPVGLVVLNEGGDSSLADNLVATNLCDTIQNVLHSPSKVEFKLLFAIHIFSQSIIVLF